LLDAGDLVVSTLYARVRTRFVAPEEWAAYDPLGISMFNANTREEWERVLALASADDLEPVGDSP
jgi:hypothetical protein